MRVTKVVKHGTRVIFKVLPDCPVTWKCDELAQWIKDMWIFAVQVYT